MVDYTHAPLSAYRVKPHRPWRTALVVAILITVAVVGGLMLYELGVRHGGHEKYQARATETRLRIQRDELRERVRELADANARLERSQRIEQATARRLERMLEAREQAMGQLEEELAFYQSLVSPADGDDRGLTVERFSLTAAGGGEYSYELVLTRLNRDDTRAEGRVDLILDALRGAEEVSLSLADLQVGDETPELEFRFRYFQRLHGTIRLPEEIEPVQLKVRVRPETEGLDSVESLYSWSSLISGGT